MSEAAVKSKLSQKDVFKSYVYWMMFALSCQNMERMEAPAFAGVMGRMADKLYNSIEDKEALMMRHTQFYNTQPMVGAMVTGIALGMEEERACGKEVPDELIQSVKTSLMGPFAGIGDSLFIGTLIPILLSIGLGLVGDNGSIAGPLFYAVAWLAIMIPFTWLTYKWGYKSGINAVQTIYKSGIMDKAVRFANILGLVIVGCITGQYVSFGIGWSYTSGEMTMNIQGVLDGIFPGALPLLITIACWYLMDKKKVSMGKIMIGLFVICLVGKFLGIIA
jgi:mannose/fructose/N-acetylgalactosamine-specific phosphotransferase system component IID